MYAIVENQKIVELLPGWFPGFVDDLAASMAKTGVKYSDLSDEQKKYHDLDQSLPVSVTEDQVNNFKKWKVVRVDRDQKIANMEWKVSRHQQEIALSYETTLSDTEYSELLTYIQALRDIPQTQTDPFNIVWPEV